MSSEVSKLGEDLDLQKKKVDLSHIQAPTNFPVA